MTGCSPDACATCPMAEIEKKMKEEAEKAKKEAAEKGARKD
jgi:hypothetical protein